MVAEEDVRRGKPDPEGFLAGAALMNRHPAGTLVFGPDTRCAGRAGGRHAVYRRRCAARCRTPRSHARGGRMVVCRPGQPCVPGLGGRSGTIDHVDMNTETTSWSPSTQPGVNGEAVVDLDAIAHNVGVLREHAGPASVMAVVKADGYITAPPRWPGRGRGRGCRTGRRDPR